MSLGELYGMRPSTDDVSLPVTQITNIFNEVYQPPTTPVIMEPYTLNPTKLEQPLYCSLMASSYCISSKKTFRPLQYLNEIKDAMSICLRSFSEYPYTMNTYYSELVNRYSYEYYSAQGDGHGIKESARLMADDRRFRDIYKRYQGLTHYGFPNRSHFTKALISIKPKVFVAD